MNRIVIFRVGLALLLLAAVLVGLAILVDGSAGRVLNGAGGALWFVSAAILLLAAIRSMPPTWLWLALAALTLLVAFVVTPSALVPTILGFVPAGLTIAWLAPRDRLLWAAMVPAWYLPAHIGTAVTKAAIRSVMGHEAPLRTDPPPTAAFVPLLMVICALFGGFLAAQFAQRQGDDAATVDRRS